MKRSSLLLAALATLATLTPSGTAQADRLTATREQPLVEVSHTVDVTIDDGVARYRVRRTFANNGVRSEEASLRIELAHGAAVTGLRIRARDRWYDGVLMDAEEARAKYQELTGIGAWEAKDPALLQWVWADQVHLQVFPVLPGAVSTVEYTLTAPLEYRGGRHVLTYPHTASVEGVTTLALADPVVRVDPGHGDARTEIRIGGQRVAPNTPVVLRAPPPLAWIGEGEADPGTGYVFSKLTVDRSAQVTRATVDLEIDHTFRGDLFVDLVTPGGEHLRVTAGEGGENDLRGSFPVELPASSRGGGRLALDRRRQGRPRHRHARRLDADPRAGGRRGEDRHEGGRPAALHPRRARRGRRLRTRADRGRAGADAHARGPPRARGRLGEERLSSPRDRRGTEAERAAAQGLGGVRDRPLALGQRGGAGRSAAHHRRLPVARARRQRRDRRVRPHGAARARRVHGVRGVRGGARLGGDGRQAPARQRQRARAGSGARGRPGGRAPGADADRGDDGRPPAHAFQ